MISKFNGTSTPKGSYSANDRIEPATPQKVELIDNRAIPSDT